MNFDYLMQKGAELAGQAGVFLKKEIVTANWVVVVGCVVPALICKPLVGLIIAGVIIFNSKSHVSA